MMTNKKSIVTDSYHKSIINVPIQIYTPIFNDVTYINNNNNKYAHCPISNTVYWKKIATQSSAPLCAGESGFN